MKEFNGKIYEEGKPHDMEDLKEIVRALRNPEDGCPWDSAQTHETLKDCFVNEAKEVLEAIENKDDDNLCEELGDVLLQVIFHAEIASERGAFSFEDVVQTISDKMIRRHPYVFGDARLPKDREEGKKLWEEIKAKEKEEKRKKREREKKEDK